MKSNFFRTILFLGIFLTGFSAFSQDGIPDKPQPQRLVNDYAGILSAEEINALEQKLVHFNDSTSTQIVVVLLNDLGGRDETDYADRLGEKWGVGQKGKDNGIVILIKPKVGQEKGKARISVGYGLEGVIPDATARRIVDNEMIPNFKKNQYYQGINAAVDVLISLSKGEFSAAQYDKKTSKSPFLSLIPIIIIVFIIILLANNKRKGPMSPGKSLPFWMLLGMMGSSRSSSGSWGGFSGGGSSGGGFGGFGGGSFGGGGASGSW